MTRFVSVCAAVGLVISAGAAQADTGTLPNGAMFTFTNLRVHEAGNPELILPTPDQLRLQLNLAHCTCSKAGLGDEQVLDFEVRLTTSTGTHRPGEVFVGTQCDQELLRAEKCRQITTIPDIDLLATHVEHLQVSQFDVINGVDTGPCQQREGDAFLWIGVDTTGSGTLDFFTNVAVGKTQTGSTMTGVNGIDTLAPELPTEITAKSAEESIVLAWTPSLVRPNDVFEYQALCVGPDGLPVVATDIEPAYQTARMLCGLEEDLPLTDTTITTGDEGSMVTAATLPTAVQQLDPAFLCGKQGASARGMTIENLENGVPVSVVLLVVDKAGNVTGTVLSETITPEPVTDFWEDLHDRGSDVEGGFCLLAETYGDQNPLTQALRSFRDDTLARTSFGRWLIDAYYGSLAKLGAVVHGSLALRIVAGVLLVPLVAIALAWHALTLPGLLAVLALLVVWKRRRKWLLAALALLLPSIASAQGQTPYWEDNMTEATSLEEGLVKWHVGVRIGPYTPNIDGQLNMDPGPYEQMFGGHQWMPMLDVDRILWGGFGQLGVGGSIGYMQKTAHAWVFGSDPMDPNRPRSPGDTNTFHMLPLMVSGIYRFTWFDDEFGVPIVPYARVGLAYYLWWISTNGGTSTVCEGGTTIPGCDENKARGGSLGVVGSIGLSIRAERIDKAAAQSMRSSGIQHAGFFAEWSVGKVDWFEPDKKLSVGDSTWFAGVDFEF